MLCHSCISHHPLIYRFLDGTTNRIERKSHPRRLVDTAYKVFRRVARRLKSQPTPRIPNPEPCFLHTICLILIVRVCHVRVKYGVRRKGGKKKKERLSLRLLQIVLHGSRRSYIKAFRILYAYFIDMDLLSR